MRPELVKADPVATREVLAGLLPPVDRGRLTGEFAEDLAADMADGLVSAGSTAGWTTTSRSPGLGASTSPRSPAPVSSGRASRT